MAENGLTGQRFSHAPHPMQRSASTDGTKGEFSSFSSFCTNSMAPAGQCLAQLPQSSPLVTVRQFSKMTTACPIRVSAFSSRVIGLMAPVGQTSEHRVHSGRQYPLSYDITGCMMVIRLVDGLSTPLGQSDTQSWHPVHLLLMFAALNEPGGVIGVFRAGIFFSSIFANPPSTFCFSWAITAVVTNAVANRNDLLPLSFCSVYFSAPFFLSITVSSTERLSAT